jgi:K+/H+ antiporter YhaU regulatory subunit KhtT
LTLTEASPAVGASVVTLNIRAKTGASVVSVIRDGVTTRNIGAEWEFRIGDTLIVMGDAHQLAALKDLLGVTS